MRTWLSVESFFSIATDVRFHRLLVLMGLGVVASLSLRAEVGASLACPSLGNLGENGSYQSRSLISSEPDAVNPLFQIDRLLQSLNARDVINPAEVEHTIRTLPENILKNFYLFEVDLTAGPIAQIISRNISPRLSVVLRPEVINKLFALGPGKSAFWLEPYFGEDMNDIDYWKGLKAGKFFISIFNSSYLLHDMGHARAILNIAKLAEGYQLRADFEKAWTIYTSRTTKEKRELGLSAVEHLSLILEMSRESDIIQNVRNRWNPSSPKPTHLRSKLQQFESLGFRHKD